LVFIFHLLCSPFFYCGLFSGFFARFSVFVFVDFYTEAEQTLQRTRVVGSLTLAATLTAELGVRRQNAQREISVSELVLIIRIKDLWELVF
jgi:hypothetical protein